MADNTNTGQPGGVNSPAPQLQEQEKPKVTLPPSPPPGTKVAPPPVPTGRGLRIGDEVILTGKIVEIAGARGIAYVMHTSGKGSAYEIPLTDLKLV